MNRAEAWPETAALGARLRRIARAALAAGPPAGTEASLSTDGELSISFVSEEEIRDLNRRYLGRDRATDVIAFDLGEEGALLGDVYIAPEVARRAAREARIPVAEEVLRLTAHGVLHVLGHEHPEGEERWQSAMYRIQERLVAGERERRPLPREEG